jgi:hypothetical protein
MANRPEHVCRDRTDWRSFTMPPAILSLACQEPEPMAT